MKNKMRIAVQILLLIFCMLLGCERKEEKQAAVLFPIEEEAPAYEAAAGAEAEDEAKESSGEDAVLMETPAKTCTVHICGAIRHPGVYVLEEGSRIYQAVEEAGGFCEDSDENYLNQAELLKDGMKLYIPTKEEAAAASQDGNWQSFGLNAASGEENALVNINTAGEELLCTLPGVGSSRAKSIMSYREKNGEFQKIEDIMNVEGIKDGLFQKIKDSITV